MIFLLLSALDAAADGTHFIPLNEPSPGASSSTHAMAQANRNSISFHLFFLRQIIIFEKKKKHREFLCVIFYWLNGVTPVAADLSRIAHTNKPTTMVNCAKFDRSDKVLTTASAWNDTTYAAILKTLVFFRFWLVPRRESTAIAAQQQSVFRMHVEIEQNNENKELFLLSFRFFFFFLERRNYAKSESARCDTVVRTTTIQRMADASNGSS